MSVAFALSVTTLAHAEPLRAGAKLPELRLSDQHGVEATVGADDEIVIFSRDMAAGKIVKAALAERGGATLAAVKGVYIADITAMPAVITSLFALPSMRKRDYRIVLDRDGKATADFPSKEGEVTVMKLDDGTIAQVDFVDSEVALLALLKGP
jgi:NADPH-dependent ferric siderophore reductase